MDALVNYGSEDEQDEYSGQTVADRGRSPRKNRSGSAIGSGSNGSGSGHSLNMRANGGAAGSSSSSRNAGGTAGGARNNSSNYKDEEDSQKYRTYPSKNRSTSYSHENSRNEGRDGRYNRDERTARSSRDTRDFKMHDRSHSKDYRDEHRRDGDSYRDGRRPTARDEDRNYHHGRQSYSSSTSVHHKDRYNSNTREERSRYSDSSVRHQQHHQRPRDEREERSNRYERSDSSRGRHQRTRESHSRSRSRTPRSNSPERECTRYQGQQPLEQARLSALEMERKLNVTDDQHDAFDKSSSTSAAEIPARRIEALLSLPLSDSAPKQPNLIAVTPSSSISGNAAISSSLRNVEPAVIQLPSYYNPCVINPNKYAEQVQKRKLLWGAKKNEDTTAKWGHAQFSQDSDGKVASKFMRLMGIKGAAAPKVEAVVEEEQKAASTSAPDVKLREAMFSSMEQQYEVARQATHTMRGVGLGFGSQSRPF